MAVQLQKTVALSTMEAKYVALAGATQEALWLSKLMLDITRDDQLPIPIKCDNTTALTLAKTPENHDRAKHIDTKYYMVRDEIENKRVALEYIESRRNIGDILTKPLAIQLHQYLTSMLGLKSVGITADVRLSRALLPDRQCHFYGSKGSVPEAFYTGISTVLPVSPVLCDYRASCI
jgi:hypothetical protein